MRELETDHAVQASDDPVLRPFRPWHRSRLLWLGFLGFAYLLWAWVSPLVSGEGRYLGARWIIPGNFYQGFGVTHGFHRMELWAGRPYAGLGNPMRQTGITRVNFPFLPLRDSWAANGSGPVWFQWGTPSADSFTIQVDYWFLVPAYAAAWVAAVVLRQRRNRQARPGAIPAVAGAD